MSKLPCLTLYKYHGIALLKCQSENIQAIILKNGKCICTKFQRFSNDILSSGEFSKSLANKQEAVGTYFQAVL